MKNKPSRLAPLVEPATTKEALDFVHGLQRVRKKSRAAVEEAQIEAYINQFSLGTLKSIARRIMIDIMKAPSSGGPGQGADKMPRTNRKKASRAMEAPKRGNSTPGRTGGRGRTRGL
jgi:hypothetical protein